MVRMIDLPPTKREGMERYPTPEFDTEPWVGGVPIAQRTVTLISSAGLIERGDRPVAPRDARYRVGMPPSGRQASAREAHASFPTSGHHTERRNE